MTYRTDLQGWRHDCCRLLDLLLLLLRLLLVLLLVVVLVADGAEPLGARAAVEAAPVAAQHWVLLQLVAFHVHCGKSVQQFWRGGAGFN